MDEVEKISLIDFSDAFHEVERHMDIWDWLVYNGYVIVEEDLVEEEAEETLHK